MRWHERPCVGESWSRRKSAIETYANPDDGVRLQKIEHSTPAISVEFIQIAYCTALEMGTGILNPSHP